MPNWKKVVVSGSDAVLNSVTASFTGSLTGALIGTASWAISASQALSASVATSASYAANGGVTQLLAGPNITLSPIDGKGQVTVSATLSGSTSFNTSTGSYGSFYDTTTQTNPVGNVPRSMSFDSTDITNGVSISGSTNPFNTYIKTTNAGVYNIQFSAQIDKTDSGADEIVIWLRKNGIDLTDTATTLTLSGNNDKKVAAWNWFVNSAANDYYQIIWYSADTDLRLLAEVAGGGHPGIPSVILTANRVDQFLSNTGSFSGSFTGAFTGSLFGTASWAQSASNAIIAIDAISANSAKTIATISSSVNAVFYPTFVDSNNTPSANESLFTSNVITFNPGGQVLTVRTLSAENIQITNSLTVTGSATFAGGITGSLLGTASFATSASQAISSSRATSASYALSASYAPPSSPFPFTGSALITGSLGVTGSVSITQNLTASRAYISSSNGTISGSSLIVYGSGSSQPVFTVQGSQGELFSVTDSLSGSLFSVNDISGLPILEVFSDNTTLIGDYQDPMLITTKKVTMTNSGSFVVYSLPTASYDTAFFDYSIKSGSNARAGQIMAIQSGASVNFTETTTTDFGSTTAVSFTVLVSGSNMVLTGSASTGSWTIKTIVRGI